MGGAHASAVETAGAHTATMKSSTATEPSAAATAGISIIGNETDGYENERCQNSKNASKHGIPPL
jgi:hypothetical protein